MKLGFSEESIEEYKKAISFNIDINKIFEILNPLYNNEQIKELVLGLNQNLDISYYNDLSFSGSQMHAIRLGLLQKVDVSIYNKKEYNEGVMNLLRKALLKKTDISFLKNKNFVFTEHQLKNYLELKDMNVSEHIITKIIDFSYNEDCLRLIQRIILSGFDINNILDRKYKKNHLSFLNKAIENKLDTNFFIKTFELDLENDYYNLLMKALIFNINLDICEKFINLEISKDNFINIIEEKYNNIMFEDILINYYLKDKKQYDKSKKEQIRDIMKLNIDEKKIQNIISLNYSWEVLEEIKFAFEDGLNNFLDFINPSMNDLVVSFIRREKLLEKEIRKTSQKAKINKVLDKRFFLEDKDKLCVFFKFYKEKNTWIIERQIDNKIILKNLDFYLLVEDFKQYLRLTKDMSYEEILLLY